MGRILVIEDNWTNLDLMIYLLEAFGHEPMKATSGQAGLELARRELPDLIICDVHMPNMDGYEVARHLKNHPTLSTIPLIAVTAFAMVGDRDKVLAAGFDGYISKPIVPETFVSDVEAYLQPIQRAAPRQPAPITAGEALPPRMTDKNITILVVDNSAINRALARSTLEPAGYCVVEARNVQECLGLARESPPDLILSDVHMPVATGYDLLKAVKTDEQLKDIPFVLITSTSQYEMGNRYEGHPVEADDFIFRPIEPQFLLAKIESCLKKS